ncbi:MAG: uroporphyrinogen decarboxylase family protein [Anaerolineae bacterium]|jgi:uroporphyrinogen-III decarboxylase
MTGRDKIEAAFSPQGTTDFAAVICYEGIFIRDHWDDLTECPWWYQEAPDLSRQVAWRRDVIRRTGQDWFVLPTVPPRAEREAQTLQVLGGQVVRVDRRTGREEQLVRPAVAGWNPLGHVQSIHPQERADTPEEIDARVPPPPANPEQAVAKGVGDLARALLEEFGQELYPIRHVPSPLWCTYDLWGFDGMMEMVASRPDLVRHACERYLARSLYHVRLSAALGARGIWIEECMTDMVSPDAFARLNLPYLQRLVEEIRSAGMHAIYYYCGNPNDRWEHLFASGADALALEEGKKGFEIDIEEVARRADRRCAILGNLDAVGILQDADDATLRAEIERQLAAGRRNGGRFVMSIGSPVTPSTPVGRVRRYCGLVRELSQAMSDGLV